MPKTRTKLTAQIRGAEYEKERLRIIFEYSPVAIWEEDFSALARLREKLKKRGATNYRKYLKDHPELVKETFRGLKVLDVNNAALDLYGAKTKQELMANLGKTIHKEAMVVLVDEFATLIEGKRIFEAEFKSKTLSGVLLYDVAMRVSVPQIYKDSFKRVIVTLQDISVQKKLERHLRKLAQTDGMTGFLNHNAINRKLEEEFQRAKRYGLKLSCLMTDLDHFKMINDKFGHQKGNQVLRHVAAAIRQNLREVDIVGRYGGDEFLIILPETSQENAKTVAQRLIRVFSPRMRESENIFSNITLSIGISGLPADDIKTAKGLIAKTDKAMYTAKQKGRNSYATL